jgi:hypothetical protein
MKKMTNEQKLQERLNDQGEVLAEDESQWVTEQVLRIGKDYFYRRYVTGFPNVFECILLSRAKARQRMLDMGCDVSEVKS